MAAPTSLRINYSDTYGSTQLPSLKKGKKTKVPTAKTIKIKKPKRK